MQTESIMYTYSPLTTLNGIPDWDLEAMCMDVHAHALRRIISIWLQHKHLFNKLQEYSERDQI